MSARDPCAAPIPNKCPTLRNLTCINHTDPRHKSSTCTHLTWERLWPRGNLKSQPSNKRVRSEMLRNVTPGSSRTIAHLTFKHCKRVELTGRMGHVFISSFTNTYFRQLSLKHEEKEVSLPQIDYTEGECVCSSSEISI